MFQLNPGEESGTAKVWSVCLDLVFRPIPTHSIFANRFDSVVTGTLPQVPATGSPVAPTSSLPLASALAQENEADADPLESL